MHATVIWCNHPNYSTKIMAYHNVRIGPLDLQIKVYCIFTGNTQLYARVTHSTTVSIPNLGQYVPLL